MKHYTHFNNLNSALCSGCISQTQTNCVTSCKKPLGLVIGALPTATLRYESSYQLSDPLPHSFLKNSCPYNAHYQAGLEDIA